MYDHLYDDRDHSTINDDDMPADMQPASPKVR